MYFTFLSGSLDYKVRPKCSERSFCFFISVIRNHCRTLQVVDHSYAKILCVHDVFCVTSPRLKIQNQDIIRSLSQ